MTTPRRLYASNQSEVDSAQWIDVFLGQGNQHMLIFSGIAMPAYDSYNDDFNREHIVVMFDQVVSAIVQASATVGLASIHNTDSDFVFATDSVSVFRDDDSGRLALDCQLAVQGDYSLLSRFSYHAVVIASIDEPYVSGLIRWDPGVTGPRSQPLLHPIHSTPSPPVSPLFKITALRDLSSPSDPSYPIAVPTPLAFTSETPAPTVGADGLHQVPYTLRLGNVPNAVGEPFYLQGAIEPGAFPHAHTELVLEQTSGPSFVTLSGSHLHEDGVDFLVTAVQVPK